MVSATQIVLASSSGSLILSIDEKGVGGWCQVHLFVSGARRSLGAERLKYIASSLLSFLREPEGPRGLRSVLGLSELHTSVYGEHVGLQAKLDFQDADANTFATVVLTPAERSQWVHELSKYTAD
jgi:hypothetical protein